MPARLPASYQWVPTTVVGAVGCAVVGHVDGVGEADEGDGLGMVGAGVVGACAGGLVTAGAWFCSLPSCVLAELPRPIPDELPSWLPEEDVPPEVLAGAGVLVVLSADLA